MVHERTEAYAGVDVSKERLEVCVRRGREAGEGEHTFGVPNDPAGTETLLARLLEERPVLVILEANAWASNGPWPRLWPPRGCRSRW
jgi:hypothetical protein